MRRREFLGTVAAGMAAAGLPVAAKEKALLTARERLEWATHIAIVGAIRIAHDGLLERKPCEQIEQECLRYMRDYLKWKGYPDVAEDATAEVTLHGDRMLTKLNAGRECRVEDWATPRSVLRCRLVVG